MPCTPNEVRKPVVCGRSSDITALEEVTLLLPLEDAAPVRRSPSLSLEEHQLLTTLSLSLKAPQAYVEGLGSCAKINN